MCEFIINIAAKKKNSKIIFVMFFWYIIQRIKMIFDFRENDLPSARQTLIYLLTRM